MQAALAGVQFGCLFAALLDQLRNDPYRPAYSDRKAFNLRRAVRDRSRRRRAGGGDPAFVGEQGRLLDEWLTGMYGPPLRRKRNVRMSQVGLRKCIRPLLK
jgi:hypothetical protein